MPSQSGSLVQSVNPKKKLSQIKKIKTAFYQLFNWYPSVYDKKEKILLFKLDVTLLIYACVSFFCKYLDQTNINNAYVSGMKEDLGLYGNQLNWLNIVYLSGYTGAQLPLLLIYTKPKFSKYLLPTCEVIFSILTFCQAEAKTIGQLYCIRFFVGVFEAPFFTGFHYTLGKYYGTKSYKGAPVELYMRSGVFFLSSSLGTMFSGYLQAAAYTNLDGNNGKPGWKWLFIIDGSISIVVGVLGFVFWPGSPEAGKPWFLSKEEFDLVLIRNKRNKIQEVGKLDFKAFKRTFTDWKVYLYVGAFTAALLSLYPTVYLSLWMKAQKTYSVVQVNRYPTVSSAVNVVTIYLASALFSVYAPWKFAIVAVIVQTIFGGIMIKYNVPKGVVLYAFWQSGVFALPSPLIYNAINRVLKHDPEQKAIVMGTIMTFSYFIYTWAPLGLYPTAQSYGSRAAPQWSVGYPVCLAMAWVFGIFYLSACYLEERERKRNGQPNIEEEMDAALSGNSVEVIEDEESSSSFTNNASLVEKDLEVVQTIVTNKSS